VLRLRLAIEDHRADAVTEALEGTGGVHRIVALSPERTGAGVVLAADVMPSVADQVMQLIREWEISDADYLLTRQDVVAPYPPHGSVSGGDEFAWIEVMGEARTHSRPLGRYLSKILIRAPFSPNQVSIVSALIGILSGWFFAGGNFISGALLLQFSAIIDCVDGDLARVLYKESRLGKWLDLVGDQFVHIAVFAGISFGLARSDPALPALALGTSAVLGTIISFAVIVLFMRRKNGRKSSGVEKLIDATTNRDFSLLVLLLAIAGKLDLFLWMAGLGVHLFWIIAICLQWQDTGRAPAISEKSA